MQIPFIGGSEEGRSRSINASRSINFMPEVNSADSKAIIALVGTPGTKTFTRLGPEAIRMTHTVADRCFVVVGTTLSELFSNGNTAFLATLPDSVGRIPVADNGIKGLVGTEYVGGNQLLMLTNGKGYIYDLSAYTLSEITDPDFPTDPQQVEFIDGYFVVTNGTMGYKVSDLYDGTSWGGLAFGAAVSSADVIQKPVNFHQQLLLIKENVTEVWYNAAVPTTQGTPFARSPGGIINFGTPAPWSVAKGHDTLFMLANQRNADAGEPVGVVCLEGNYPKLISTPSINYRISRMDTISDAYGYCYADEGHLFYVLTFPTEDLTLVYDLSTQMWHERASYITEPSQQRRHVGDTYTFFAGKHLVGHYETGTLLEMSTKYYDDNGEQIISTRTAPIIFDKNDNVLVPVLKLAIDAEMGVGTSEVIPDDQRYPLKFDGSWSFDGSCYFGITGGNVVLSHNADPQIWLSWSNDGGYTWSKDYPASIGKMGEYRKRMVWRRLGMARGKTFRIRCNDAVKKVIIGAYIS